MKIVARWLSVAYLPTKIWSHWTNFLHDFLPIRRALDVHPLHYIIASNLSKTAYIKNCRQALLTHWHTKSQMIHNNKKKIIIERCLFSIHFVCSYWWNGFNAELYRTVPMCNSINTIPIHIVIVTNVLHFVLSKLSTGIRLKIHGQHAPIHIYIYICRGTNARATKWRIHAVRHHWKRISSRSECKKKKNRLTPAKL